MANLLCGILTGKGDDIKDTRTRGRLGTLASVVGICVNLLLFAGKFAVGLLTSSISITADALNNLSDAGSSVMALVSFGISAKPADRKHPFGHARIEYIASMMVSVAIIIIGFSLLRESLSKAVSGGEAANYGTTAFIVLLVSIALKLLLCLFYRRVGKFISSDVLKAAAADSLSDVVSTAAVLLGVVVYRFTSLMLDAYIGVAVAVFILISGAKIFKEATDSILGEAPGEKLENEIRSIVFSHPEALGIHDLALHNYGPGRTFASAHVEVDGGKDVYASHDAIDRIEREIESKLGIKCVIHLDPVAVGDPLTDKLYAEVREKIKDIDERITVHDFRIVPGTTHTNIIFDVVVPFEVKLSDEEIIGDIKDKIDELGENYYGVITVDRQ